MSASAKLTAFAVVLALLFGGGALAGAAIGPEPEEPADAHGATETAAHAEPEGEHGGGHGSEGAAAPAPVRGLGVAEGGLRVVVEDPELRRGRTERLAFRI